MPKLQTSIQFDSYQELRTFMRAINTEFYEVSFTKFIVTCECTKQDRELAIEIYNGKVMNAMQELKQVTSS